MLMKLNKTVMLQDLMLLLAEHYFRVSVTGTHVQQMYPLEMGSALWNCTDTPVGRWDVGHFFTFPLG